MKNDYFDELLFDFLNVGVVVYECEKAVVSPVVTVGRVSKEQWRKVNFIGVSNDPQTL